MGRGLAPDAGAASCAEPVSPRQGHLLSPPMGLFQQWQPFARIQGQSGARGVVGVQQAGEVVAACPQPVLNLIWVARTRDRLDRLGLDPNAVEHQVHPGLAVHPRAR